MTATGTTAKPKNLAELKRYVKPGMRLIATFYLWREYQHIPQTRETLTVQEINSVAIIFAPNAQLGNDRPLYSTYQKAANYRFTETGYSITDSEGVVYASYEYPEGA